MSASSDLFPIVGIGASAGGLEAMTRLLRALPNDNPMALVLVQHLDPNHESMLVDILSRETPMPVREVSDGMPVRPQHLYVIPPNASMDLVDGSFRVGRRQRAPGRPPLPIDEFFTSLAGTRRSAAIGVVLSGNASDGMLGMRAIKAEGGITFAQDESAQFQGMPRAAISAGAADFVLPPEEIARELDRVSKHPFLYMEKGKEERPDEDTLRKIFGMVRTATGVDFSHYRQSTILRRLARRMAVNKVEDFGAYLSLLKKTPAEVSALNDDFLISVTSFFRDPGTFDLLRTRIFPDLMKNRRTDQSVRMWVPGCATGEEAYSLAICAAESQEISPPGRGPDLRDRRLGERDRPRAARDLSGQCAPERLAGTAAALLQPGRRALPGGQGNPGHLHLRAAERRRGPAVLASRRAVLPQSPDLPGAHAAAQALPALPSRAQDDGLSRPGLVGVRRAVRRPVHTGRPPPPRLHQARRERRDAAPVSPAFVGPGRPGGSRIRVRARRPAGRWPSCQARWIGC